MNEIFQVIFGEYTGVQIFGYIWFLIIGYILYGLNETTSRNKLSSKTPRKWKWKFWIMDNWRRYLFTILSTYVFFRFYIEFVGHELTNFEALMIGLIGDGIGATAKNRIAIVKVNREKIMEAERIIEANNEEIG
jgi:Na+/H+ antiporter NhaD/arsenite permease-like protein